MKEMTNQFVLKGGYMDPKAILRINKEAMCTELEEEGEAVLLHLATKVYYTLNETGLFIYRRIEEEAYFGEIIEALCSAYDVTAEEAETEAESLVRDLEREGFCNVEDP